MACQAAGENLFIEPGSPWENGYIESFYATQGWTAQSGDLNTLQEANVLTAAW